MDIRTLLEYREREPLIGGDPKEVLPPYKIKEIRILIRKGAGDLKQHWKSANELCNKAYEVAGCEIPTPTMIDGWTDYKQMLELSVNALARTRGPHAEWRQTLPPSEPEDAAPGSKD